MGKFIEQNLASGEKVIYETAPHWIELSGGIVLAALSAPFLAGAFYLHVHDLQSVGDLGMAACLLFGGGLFVVALWLGLAGWATMASSEYAVTKKRVILKTGLLSRRVVETQLGKIESFTVTQGILGRIFNYGSVLLHGSGGLSEGFDCVKDPYAFKKAVEGQAG